MAESANLFSRSLISLIESSFGVTDLLSKGIGEGPIGCQPPSLPETEYPSSQGLRVEPFLPEWAI